eukprot:3173365-Rhodomonas_salina.1
MLLGVSDTSSGTDTSVCCYKEEEEEEERARTLGPVVIKQTVAVTDKEPLGPRGAAGGPGGGSSTSSTRQQAKDYN